MATATKNRKARVSKVQNTINQAEAYKVLGNVHRLNIVKFLNAKPGMTVGALARALGISQPLTSNHLGRMRALGFVHGERFGKEVHYTVDTDFFQTVEPLIK